MTVDIKSNIENPMLGRKEVIADIAFKGPTAKRAELKTQIAGKIGANPELCILRKVTNRFGVNKVSVIMHVYEKAEKLKSVEPYYILVREGMAEKKKKEPKKKAVSKSVKR